MPCCLFAANLYCRFLAANYANFANIRRGTKTQKPGAVAKDGTCCEKGTGSLAWAVPFAAGVTAPWQSRLVTTSRAKGVRNLFQPGNQEPGIPAANLYPLTSNLQGEPTPIRLSTRDQRASCAPPILTHRDRLSARGGGRKWGHLHPFSQHKNVESDRTFGWSRWLSKWRY